LIGSATRSPGVRVSGIVHVPVAADDTAIFDFRDHEVVKGTISVGGLPDATTLMSDAATAANMFASFDPSCKSHFDCFVHFFALPGRQGPTRAPIVTTARLARMICSVYVLCGRRKFMQSDIEKRFRRSHISADDFDRALTFIKEARKQHFRSTIYEALLISAIIYYARPFSSNEQRKNPNPLSEATIDKELMGFEDPKEQKLHDEIIDLRNKAVAHAEYGQGKYTINHVSVEPTGQTSILSSVWRPSNEWFDLFTFERIATEMRARCHMAVSEDLLISYPVAAKE
jgi:hypothetical protein